MQYTNGSIHATEDLSRLGEVMSTLDLEESGLPSLADLSTDSRYQSFTVAGVGESGCVLRYFSIQPISTVRPPHTYPNLPIGVNPYLLVPNGVLTPISLSLMPYLPIPNGVLTPTSLSLMVC
jgi:hypothetical protein